ncbi:class A sortase [Weissella confusa]|uniref:class A sortase n=1 Tax=Weissella confusa TaxID=1583 RepID=UPI0035A2996C
MGKQSFQHSKKIKTVIIVILTLAAVLFSVPFLQDFYTCYVKSTTSVKYVSKLPKVIQPAETIHAPTLQTVMNMNTHARTAVGRVVMPSVGLDDDIYAGLTNENLFYGAVTLFPNRTVRKHNLVLIGHNMGHTKVHFGVLEGAKVGQKAYLQYLGKYYQYTVYKTSTILETEINKVKDTVDSELSLVTCSAPTRTPKRILVQAKLDGEITKPRSQVYMQRSHMNMAKNTQKSVVGYDFWPLFVIWLVYLLLVILVIVLK